MIICSQSNHDCILIVLRRNKDVYKWPIFTFFLVFVLLIILYACLPFMATKLVYNDDPQVRSKHFFMFAVTAIVSGEH